MRAKAQIDKKGAALAPRRHGPPSRRAPVPLHRLRQSARRDRIGRARQDVRGPSSAAAVGESGAKYEAEALALGDRDYIDDIRFAGQPILHAALHLTAHTRADIQAIDLSRALGAEAWSRRSPPRTFPAS